MASACSTISSSPFCKVVSSCSIRNPLTRQALRFRSQPAVPIRFSLAASRELSFFKGFPESIKFRSSVAAGDEAELATIENEANEASAAPASTLTDQTVSVTVSPSDVLTMFFQAEGTMTETAIPTVTQALEEAEGITDLKVKVLEGIASVELTKQTTVQATGVASNLVEIIQSKGFKLQTLNLSFQDEDDLN